MKISTVLLLGATLTVAWSAQAADRMPIGTVAIYSDGQVEKLVEKSSAWTLWESARKRLYKRSYLGFLPTLEYTRFPTEKGGYRQRVVGGDPRQLAPYGSADSSSFRLLRTRTDGTGSEAHWRCTYEGQGNETLMDKTIGVDRYSCTRYNPFSKKPFKEQRDMSVATDLGIVVKEVVTRPGRSDKETRLSYLLRPSEATADRIAAAVKSLK